MVGRWAEWLLGWLAVCSLAGASEAAEGRVDCVWGRSSRGDEVPRGRTECPGTQCCFQEKSFLGPLGSFAGQWGCESAGGSCGGVAGLCVSSHGGRLQRCLCQGHLCNLFGHQDLVRRSDAPSPASSPLVGPTPAPTSSSAPPTPSPTRAFTSSGLKTTTPGSQTTSEVAEEVKSETVPVPLGLEMLDMPAAPEVEVAAGSKRRCLVGRSGEGEAEPRRTALCGGSCLRRRESWGGVEWGCHNSSVFDVNGRTSYCLHGGGFCVCAAPDLCNSHRLMGRLKEWPVPPSTPAPVIQDDETESLARGSGTEEGSSEAAASSPREGWVSAQNPFLWAFVVVLCVLLVDLAVGAHRSYTTYRDRP